MYAVGFFVALAAGALDPAGVRVIGAVEPKKGTASRTRIQSTPSPAARAKAPDEQTVARRIPSGGRITSRPLASVVVLLVAVVLMRNRASFDSNT